MPVSTHPLSRHQLVLKVKFKLKQAHVLRQSKHTKEGTNFKMHDDTAEGEESVVVKLTKDKEGVCNPSAPSPNHPAHQPNHNSTARR